MEPKIEMEDLESLATETCRGFLTAAQMKTLCRNRGFPVPSGPKDALAETVRVRMLSPAGAGEALSSLAEDWQVVLHAIAMADQPPGLRDLVPALAPDQSPWRVDYRRLFSKLADGLLTTGTVLVRDSHGYRDPRRSRFEALSFVLPETFRSMLPPFPVPTAPIAEGETPGGPHRFARRALERAARLAAGKEKPGADLLDRLAGRIAFRDGVLSIGDRPLTSPNPLLTAIRREWIAGVEAKQRAAAQAAVHVLSHLPPGEGVTAGDLARAVGRLRGGKELTPGRMFFAEGVESGLLVKGRGSEPLYRAETAWDEPDAGQVAFEATEEGILAHPVTCGLKPLLEVAGLSRAEPHAAGLRLVPDPVRIGRSIEKVAALESMESVMAGSSAYARAVAAARRLSGLTLLHSGLAVLRVDEPILLATITHGLPEAVRPLGGPWLAALAGALPEVISLAEREGYRPRTIS